MLQLTNIYKSFKTNNGTKEVLRGVNLIVHKGEKIAILGRNGAGKSTLINLIGGLEIADKGSIKTLMSISWPLGYNGGMQGSLSGIDNINFLCRIYGERPGHIINYVNSFAELGTDLRAPVKTYSAGMRGRLNFALSMAFNFDCLLIDEGLSAGDSRFTEKCKNALKEKGANCAILMVSHSEDSIKDFCDQAYVLEEGKLLAFQSIPEAYAYYKPQLNNLSIE